MPPDTPEIAKQFGDAFAHLQASRGDVLWVEEMLPRAQVRQVLSHATVFACPSVYEPLGIVNLEAMACETAVVASAVGGIPEVVVDGETGYLVPYDPAKADDPAAVAEFEQELADKINSLTADPELAAAFGAGRPAALHRRVQLGQDRRRDGRGLPAGHRGARRLRRPRRGGYRSPDSPTAPRRAAALAELLARDGPPSLARWCWPCRGAGCRWQLRSRPGSARRSR